MNFLQPETYLFRISLWYFFTTLLLGSEYTGRSLDGGEWRAHGTHSNRIMAIRILLESRFEGLDMPAAPRFRIAKCFNAP